MTIEDLLFLKMTTSMLHLYKEKNIQWKFRREGGGENIKKNIRKKYIKIRDQLKRQKKKKN